MDISTIYRMVRREGFTWKRLTKIAIERKELERAGFQLRISKYRAEQLVFVDETSKDDRTTFRNHGYAWSGRKATRRTQFVRNTRYSVLPALGIDGFFAYKVVEGMYILLVK